MSAIELATFAPDLGGGLFDAYAYLRDQQSAGTQGGSSSSGSWNTRVLNTEVSDSDGIVSISANQFTLAAGRYLIRARAPFQNSGVAKLRIRNVTDSTTALIGGQSNAASNSDVPSFVIGEMTIAATKTFELQYQSSASQATSGLGVATNFGEVEVFAEVEIWRFQEAEEVSAGGGIGLFDAYALLEDQKPDTTDGGTFTSGAWQTRVLNTEVADAAGMVALASNQFTLTAGTYLIKARAPAYDVNRHQIRLQNITDAVPAKIGATGFNSTAGDNQTDSFLIAVVTITGTKTFEIQHRCETTSATFGFGVAADLGVGEVYTQVEIWRFIESVQAAIVGGKLAAYTFCK
jgi:hypothetical protein